MSRAEHFPLDCLSVELYTLENSWRISDLYEEIEPRGVCEVWMEIWAGEKTVRPKSLFEEGWLEAGLLNESFHAQLLQSEHAGEWNGHMEETWLGNHWIKETICMYFFQEKWRQTCRVEADCCSACVFCSSTHLFMYLLNIVIYAKLIISLQLDDIPVSFSASEKDTSVFLKYFTLHFRSCQFFICSQGHSQCNHFFVCNIKKQETSLGFKWCL